MTTVLRIGSFELEAPFVQAALSGYSDLAMRRLARRYGASYTLSEVILDKFVLKTGKKQRRILRIPDDNPANGANPADSDDHPVGGQLMGGDPGDFAPAAVALVEAGYDIIDINFGCPVKKVLGRCRGGFLLSTPGTALEIIRRVYDAIGATTPVTVKMRRGSDDTAEAERNFFKILDGAFETGVSAVTVHGRTVAQRYQGPSKWTFIAKIKRHVGDRTLLGSGDLFCAEDCIRMIRETGVDGVTIARGCIGNPWIFEECRALWRGESLPPPPSITQQREAIAGHWADMVEVHGAPRAARIMRKFGIKYAELHPLGLQVRDAFIAVKTPDDLGCLLDIWYDMSSQSLSSLSTGMSPFAGPGRRREGPGDLIAAGATR